MRCLVQIASIAAFAAFPRIAHAQQAATNEPADGPDTTSLAQPGATDADLVEARAQFGAGVAAFRARRYADAVIAFERSLHLRPHPTTLYNAAEARFRAGDHRGALQQLREMLSMTSPAPSQNDIDRASALAHEAGVDTLQPAEPQSVSCPVCPTCPAASRESAPCPTQPAGHPPDARVPYVPIALMVGGAVVFGTGMIFYGYALSDAYVYEDPGTADVTRRLVRPQGETFRWIGLVGVLGGIGAEIAGVMMAVQQAVPTRRADGRARLDVSPGGVMVSGTF